MEVVSTYENHVLAHPRNILDHLDGFGYGRTGNRIYHTIQVQKLALKEQLSKFQLFSPSSEFTPTFDRRITELSWHPKVPYMIGVASKSGDMMFMKGLNTDDGSLSFKSCFNTLGRGPGGAIFAIRYDESNSRIVYTAGLEGLVNRWDIERKKGVEFQFYNTEDYHVWFTAMDVSNSTKTLFAGDTKGYGYLSTLHGEKVGRVKLHTGKILHCEFNQAVPHLIATSSLDKTVKLWDLRNLKDAQCLVELPHEKGANVARFNPVNGSRMLTSDQKNEIRVYQGPLWDQTCKIFHPHRQFQHLTAIVANWHPLSDIIVIGKYPEVPKGTKPAPPRPVQFFDADTGDLIHELFTPKNGIISLNNFNLTGDVLASGQGMSLIFWKASDIQQKLSKPSSKLPRPPFDRGDGDYDSDDSDSGNSDSDSAQPKRKRRKTTSNKKSTKKAPAKTKTTRGKSKK